MHLIKQSVLSLFSTISLLVFAHTSLAISFIQQPKSQFAILGEDCTLSAAADDSFAAYQWQRSGTNLLGATSSSLTLRKTTPAMAGDFRVIVSSGHLSQTSEVAVVRVGYPFAELFSTGVEESAKVLPGATGDPHWELLESADHLYPNPQTYTFSWGPAQWLTNGSTSRWISPWDGAELQSGTYVYRTRFVLSDLDPSTAELSGQWLADSQGTEIRLNGVAKVLGAGASPSSWTAFLITNGFVLGENTLDFITINDGSLKPGGIRVELRGVALQRTPTAPIITSAPSNVSTQAEQTVMFRVAAAGASPIHFQWHQNGTELPGETNRFLRIPEASVANSGTYSVTVTNSLGFANASAELAVNTPPALAWVGFSWPGSSSFQDLGTGTLSDSAEGANVLITSAQSSVFFQEMVHPNSIVVDTAATWDGPGGGLAGAASLVVKPQAALQAGSFNTFTGPTRIEGGTLVFPSLGPGMLSQGPIINDGTLAFNAQGVSYVIANPISGTGNITIQNTLEETSRIVLLGSNSYSGTTIIDNDSSLTVRNPNALGSPAGPTIVKPGGQLRFDVNIDLDEPFNLSGQNQAGGALLKDGAGLTRLIGRVEFGGENTDITIQTNSSIEFAGGLLAGIDPALIQGPTLNLTVHSNASAIINGKLSSYTISKRGLGDLLLNGEIELLTNLKLEEGKARISAVATNCQSIEINPNTRVELSNAVTKADIRLFANTNAIFRPTLMAVHGSNACLGPVSVMVEAGQTNAWAEIDSGGPGTELHLASVPSGGLGLVLSGGGFGSIGSAGDEQGSGFYHLTKTGTGIWEVNSPIDVTVDVLSIRSGTLRFRTNCTVYEFFEFGSEGGTAVVDVNGCAFSFSKLRNTGGTTLIGNSSKTKDSRLILEDPSGGHTSYGGRICDSVNGGTQKLELDVFALNGGSLTLSNVCTYSGKTTVNGSLCLADFGSIPNSTTILLRGGELDARLRHDGTFTLTSAQTLHNDPAPGLYDMRILGKLKLEGTVELEVSKTTAGITTDRITGPTQIAFGGQLKLQLLEQPLAAGDALSLFSGGGYSGAFASIEPSEPGPGLAWDTSTLTTDGTLRVADAGSVAPRIGVTQTDGGKVLSLSWPALSGWQLEAQTNQTASGLGALWFPVPAALGTNRIFVPISTSANSVFYRLAPVVP
jgi:hypothetical protein